MSGLQIIRIEDARALVKVGVPDPERARPQEIRVSVSLAIEEPPDFIAEDRLHQTVDYDLITGFIHRDLTEPAHLVETFADRVARHCLKLSPRAIWVEVTVKKPSVLQGDGLVSVTLRRER